MLVAALFVFFGLGMLTYGADRFVEGALFLSARLGMSPMIVGIVVVGFATSAPELLVSTIAALEAHPTLSIGNAIGSNIANIGLVLGVTALIFPLQCNPSLLKVEFPLMVLGLVLSTVLMFDREIGHLDGLILMAGLFLLLLAMVLLNNREFDSVDSRKKEEPENNIGQKKETKRAVILFLIGLILLLAGSELLVSGAVSIARYFGATDVFIGLTVVAIGTSLPELAASLAGAFKKASDLVVGNVIGSNLFNALGVVAMPAFFHPFSIERIILVRDVGAMWILTLLLLFFIFSSRRRCSLGRFGGGVFLLSFLCYQIILFFG